MSEYRQRLNSRQVRAKKRQKRVAGIKEFERFVALDELAIRLGRTKRDIYRQMKKPDFLPIVKSGGKLGCLESTLLAYLNSLPRVEVS